MSRNRVRILLVFGILLGLSVFSSDTVFANGGCNNVNLSPLGAPSFPSAPTLIQGPISDSMPVDIMMEYGGHTFKVGEYSLPIFDTTKSPFPGQWWLVGVPVWATYTPSMLTINNPKINRFEAVGTRGGGHRTITITIDGTPVSATKNTDYKMTVNSISLWPNYSGEKVVLLNPYRSHYFFNTSKGACSDPGLAKKIKELCNKKEQKNKITGRTTSKSTPLMPFHTNVWPLSVSVVPLHLLQVTAHATITATTKVTYTDSAGQTHTCKDIITYFQPVRTAASIQGLLSWGGLVKKIQYKGENTRVVTLTPGQLFGYQTESFSNGIPLPKPLTIYAVEPVLMNGR